MSKNFHQLKVAELVRETKDAISVIFEVPEELNSTFEFKAGQYLTIKKEINGEEVRRSYSISAIPADNQLKITSKKVENGRMSSYLYDTLSVGDVLEVMPPDGNFTLRNTEKALILFAAGSGITPIISILKQYLSFGGPRVYLFYGNRSEEDIIFKQELEALRAASSEKFMIMHFLSSNGERLDKERVKSLVGNAQAGMADYYICGPEGMISSAKSGLEEAGLPSEEIFIEYFASPENDSTPSEMALSSEPEDIAVVLDEEEHQIQLQKGESILEGAERIGIDPPFSCRSGVCTTCKAKLIEGEVEMDNNFGLCQDEIDDGYVLTCIGYPKTAGVKINWDEA